MKINRTERVVSEVDPSVTFLLRPWNERRRTKIAARSIEANQRLEDFAREEVGTDLKHGIPTDVQEAKAHIKLVNLAEDEIRRREEELIEADPSYKSADLRDVRLLHIARQSAIEGLSAEDYRERIREQAPIVARMQVIVHDELRPIWLNAGIERIEGVEDEDGKPLSVDDFIELAPQNLVDEAYILVLRRAQLRGEEPKNSSSPSTSGAAEVGEKTTLTAPSAN